MSQVSDKEVEAAAKALEESGLMEYWPGAPALLVVRRMLEYARSAKDLEAEIESRVK